MSVHIGAQPGEIAKIVLLAGDPLRAKHIAESMLTDVKLVSTIRNAFYFTGNYKGVAVTVGASGMGCASIGIYSYELFNEYNVDCIIRIGTAGAYTEKLKVYDVLNVDRAYSESTYAKAAFNYDGDNFVHQGKAFELINETAKKLDMPVIQANIHSSDVFYRAPEASPTVAIENNCVAVEMEAFSLFANAKYLNKMAGTILTISDVIPTHEAISAEHRQSSLNKMMNLALESVVEIERYLSKK
jgi:purine-nucleoside phosphorylase